MVSEIFARDALILDTSSSILEKDVTWDPEVDWEIKAIHGEKSLKGGKIAYLLEFVGYPDRKDWVWTDANQLKYEDGTEYDNR